ncbi:ATP-binding protein [Hymenobacter puniceus]|uniref:ATP-binding protein n=1 Tax=Hymenobacter sp. BT190 TaxID=2763505 RepID=UPI0016512047|nr:ATP-binding protein [Hymenobacter sp. BT190]MBC6698696.1 GAF domain-containing protein [Hymenobacter sp. BT190]
MAQSSVSYSDENLLAPDVTLTNCDREPIHIPGLIQPYGFLLCLDEHTHCIVQVSANTAPLLGLQEADLLGAGLAVLLDTAALAEVEALLPALTETARLLGVRLHRVAGHPFYKLILHRHDGLLWVEGEPVAEAGGNAFDLPALNLTMSQLLAADSVLECCQMAADQVRALTGFDRVAIYRFAPDDSGEVIAEALHSGLPAWLGLRYPASDIPQQARAMYLKNWLRFIPDAHYQPVPLVPAVRPGATRPPDMTYSVLRSVSPIHLQYLHNLGSAATMTISLIREGVLWGMITCHHQTPRLVSYELRELCQFIGKTLSLLLRSKEQQDERDYRRHVREQQTRLIDLVHTDSTFTEELSRHSPALLKVFRCGGAAICYGGEIQQLGQTPTLTQIADLVAWLNEHDTQPIFHTSSYAQHNPAGLAIRETASGLLVISLSQAPDEYIIWFRPEQVQTVTWAGRLEKPETLLDGQLFLSPRQSFEAWKQLVEATATPWLPFELEAAAAIRQHISDVRLKRFQALQQHAADLARLNTELERSNEELDSFAYVASHDLKEPLRGIHNYSVFLLEDYADLLDAEGISRLQTLVRLSQRMEGLIESLLQLSRVGRLDLTLEDISLPEVLASVIDLLYPRIAETNTVVHLLDDLPIVRADRVRLGELFNNLITNAMRYNLAEQKFVEIGLAPDTARGPQGTGNPADYHVFYVRDNGIGIAPKHHENIFRIFKRLHAQDKFEGGTGAGLAIAKKMVEKHEGELWVESELGQGATFYFSIFKHL